MQSWHCGVDNSYFTIDPPPHQKKNNVTLFQVLPEHINQISNLLLPILHFPNINIFILRI